METDKSPTFAEALLALAIRFQTGCAWELCMERAPDIIHDAPSSIRRALWGGIPGGNSDRVRGCEDTLNRHAKLITENEVAISELEKAALGVDKQQPVVDPRELALLSVGERDVLKAQLAAAEKRAEKAEADVQSAFGRGVKLNDAIAAKLAAAVARAEKAEEQMGHDSDARQMAEAGRASAVEAMCASERKCDALRAELDKAKADVMAANLRARTAQDERDDIKAKLADAVARAEKAEAALERITRTRVDTVCPYCNEHLCSHGISETEREIVTSHAKICPKHPNREVERERDALRAELDKRTLEMSELDHCAVKAEAELDKAKAELADVEKAVSAYPMIGPVSSRVSQIVASREFQVYLAVKAGNERDALEAKLKEVDEHLRMGHTPENDAGCGCTMLPSDVLASEVVTTLRRYKEERYSLVAKLKEVAAEKDAANARVKKLEAVRDAVVEVFGNTANKLAEIRGADLAQP